ncbi:MAG: type II toxin-antitoxin system PemK/MazF family toxin [Armatimonadetes bacterium]|nr:type II toxin-antitoxin system PemK/MazF family toxin [Armatimonadota bacterium]
MTANSPNFRARPATISIWGQRARPLALNPDALPHPLRGEVWLVEFEPAHGAEIRKARPAVVMSLDSVEKLPLRLVVPLTSWQEPFEGVPWMIRVAATSANGLSRESAADTFQTRSFWTGRFVKRLGVLEASEVENIAGAIAASVGALSG